MNRVMSSTEFILWVIELFMYQCNIPCLPTSPWELHYIYTWGTILKLVRQDIWSTFTQLNSTLVTTWWDWCVVSKQTEVFQSITNLPSSPLPLLSRQLTSSSPVAVFLWDVIAVKDCLVDIFLRVTVLTPLDVWKHSLLTLTTHTKNPGCAIT